MGGSETECIRRRKRSLRKEDSVDMFTMSCPQRVPGEMLSMKLDCWNSLYLSKVTLKLSAVCNLMIL